MFDGMCNNDDADDDIEKLIPIGARVSSLETIPHSCGFACMCLLPN